MLYIPQSVERTVTPRSNLGRQFRAILNSNRLALGGALLFSVLGPELLQPPLAMIAFGQNYPLFSDFVEPENLATVLALFGVHFTLQKLNELPFVGDKIAILPTFAVSFALAATLIGVGVRGFGRYHLVAGFFIGIFWYFGLAMIRARVSLPRMAIIGGLAADDELRTSKIDWVALDRPRLLRNVSGIVFDKSRTIEPRYERLFARAVLRQIPVYELGALREMLTGRVQLHLRPEEEFGAIFPSRPYLRIKRYFDFLVALAMLPFVVPVIVLFAVIIRLESPGSAIFRQARIGYKGLRFTCFKLRSMRTDIKGDDYTTDDDPRITPVGRFIRRTRIDELPQIFNIIRGEMSWIGPRPESVPLARLYEREVAYYGYRHLVRPGVSGWAAVHQGNVALPDAAMRKLEYDFYYIKHFSPWLDFLVVLMTFRTILTGFGAR